MGHIDKNGYYLNTREDKKPKPMCFGSKFSYGCSGIDFGRVF